MTGLSFEELVARTGTFEWQREHLANALQDERRLGRIAYAGGRYSLTSAGFEVGRALLAVVTPKEQS